MDIDPRDEKPAFRFETAGIISAIAADSAPKFARPKALKMKGTPGGPAPLTAFELNEKRK